MSFLALHRFSMRAQKKKKLKKKEKEAIKNHKPDQKSGPVQRAVECTYSIFTVLTENHRMVLPAKKYPATVPRLDLVIA